MCWCHLCYSSEGALSLGVVGCPSSLTAKMYENSDQMVQDVDLCAEAVMMVACLAKNLLNHNDLPKIRVIVGAKLV